MRHHREKMGAEATATGCVISRTQVLEVGGSQNVIVSTYLVDTWVCRAQTCAAS